MQRRTALNQQLLNKVGTHPHRGFETVTIAYQGEVTHKIQVVAVAQLKLVMCNG
jgi:redox-sensitive bicupin YhaK (pirin superfamily)